MQMLTMSIMNKWEDFMGIWVEDIYYCGHDIKKMINLLKELSMCKDHMDDCLYKTKIEDEYYLDVCKCFNHDYFNFDNMIEMAKKLVHNK